MHQTPDPTNPDERPIRKIHIFWAILILVALTAGGIHVERVRIRDPWLADHEVNTFFLMCAGWLLGAILTIPIHELAHALAGWVAGFQITSISLGSGPRLYRIPLRKFAIDFHAYPLKGFYRALPFKGPNAHRRRALMIAAGPASHLLSLLVITALWFALGWNQQEHFTISSAIVAGIFIANLHLLIVNLLPRTSNWNGTPFRTDGGQLLDLWIGTHPVAVFQQNIEILVSLGNEGRWDEVQRVGRSQLKPPMANTPLYFWSFAAWVAVADVWAGGKPNLKEADLLSTYCLESSPADPALLTVRACVLMALNRNDEAESLLLQARSGVSGPAAEKAAAHLWTELHRRRNNIEQMHHWQKIAQKLDPTAAYKLLRDPVPTPAPQPTL